MEEAHLSDLHGNTNLGLIFLVRHVAANAKIWNNANPRLLAELSIWSMFL